MAKLCAAALLLLAVMAGCAIAQVYDDVGEWWLL